MKNTRRGFVDFLLWQLGVYRDPREPVPPSFIYPFPQQELDLNQPTACWINHSTFLITYQGIHILTDPIWSKRCSPTQFLGPKRLHPPAITLNQLPEIHYVLISHDHYDHLDKQTVRALHQRFPQITWLVPRGVKRWFERLGIERVLELSWWEQIPFTHGQLQLKATAVPAQHLSGRFWVNQNTTLWVGWVLTFHEEGQESKTLYFAGDTGYNSHDFKKIRAYFKQITLSLLPIGAYSPRAFMAPVHVNPKEAVQIHQDVGSLKSLGCHWKTFRLADEPMNQPPYDLFLALQEKKLDPLSFLAIEPGQKINW